jgi:2-oxoisovalerate dehydrogenase E2 component (dihydrolipoyl transacylase)
MAGFIFKLPDVGEGLAEAEIAAWHVAVGDPVSEDQPLADVMTDKATVELTSPVAGRVLARHGEVGEKRAIGSPLVEFDTAGDAAPAPAAAPAPPPIVAVPVAMPVGERPLASPAVRQKARDRGIDLRSLLGTGPGGRITHADLEVPVVAKAPVRDAITEVKIIGLRRVIAERMQDAKRRIPHFTYVEELDVTALEELRAHLNETRTPGRPKLTLLPFLMRALVRALPRWPQINARFDDDNGIVRQHAGVHFGIATQTPSGLTVPVMRHAESRDLWNCALEITRLAESARAGKAAREELSGSTITITSLGALGGIVTTPVINYPEVAIIGVNRIVERPVVRAGQIVVRKMMNLSSSFDHRVVDGWDAAAFIQYVRGLLEQPATLFIDG